MSKPCATDDRRTGQDDRREMARESSPGRRSSDRQIWMRVHE